jgi:uncharacterized protein
MKFQLSVESEAHFTGYGNGYVAVNGQRYEHSVLLMPGQPVTAWRVAAFEQLQPSDFEALLALGPEIVLLGVGSQFRFPRPEITRPLLEAHVGLEVMDTPAACRTYNILLSEDRKVLGAILV